MEEGDGRYNVKSKHRFPGWGGEKRVTKTKDVSSYRGKRQGCRVRVCMVTFSSHKGKGGVGCHRASLPLKASTEKELGAMGASCLLAFLLSFDTHLFPSKRQNQKVPFWAQCLVRNPWSMNPLFVRPCLLRDLHVRDGHLNRAASHLS